MGWLGQLSNFLAGLGNTRVFDFPVNQLTLLGLALLVVAGRVRAEAKSGGEAFNKIFQQRQPSLQSGPSPLDATIQGLYGGLVAGITKPLSWFFFFLGIDFIVFSGQCTVFLLSLFQR